MMSHGDGGDQDVDRVTERLGDAGVPPPAQRIATGSSETPMTVMTVPVTTSGKNRSSRVKTGAMSEADDPGDEQGAEDRPQTDRAAAAVPDGQHGRHGGERGALDDRLAGPDLPHAEGLQQRRDAGHEQPAETR